MRFLLVLAAVAIGALQVLDPGVGPLEQPMSSYALGAYSWVWLAAVIAAGVAMLLEARRWYMPAGQTYGPLFLCIAGVSFLMIAVFRTDPWYPWERPLTWIGWLHVIATGLGMSALSTSMLFDAIAGSRHHDFTALRVARYAGIGYLILLASIVIFNLTVITIGRKPPWIGLEERLLLTLVLVWLTARSFQAPSTR